MSSERERRDGDGAGRGDAHRTVPALAPALASDRAAGPAIRASALSKCYFLYDRPSDRLRQILWRGRRKFHREFWALRDVDLEVRPGEVVGVVGRNGAGKSTLLQLVCGTLSPTSGSIATRGRIAALLELGAGFNPEFSGRENVQLSAAILGLSRAEIDERFESIVEFSGIRDFIDQPVKTYSSGMYVRLAFSVATSVDPDVLVIDEALSVGDGEFARKSFDRIMALKDVGRTILFCSHALYHIDAICDRAIWLRDGRLEMDDRPGRVVAAYNGFLDAQHATRAGALAPGVATPDGVSAREFSAHDPSQPLAPGTARFTGIEVRADGVAGRRHTLRSRASTVEVTVDFASDPAMPAPSIGMSIAQASGTPVTSAGTANDGVVIGRDARGRGRATLVLPELPLLRGEYWLSVFLMCERGIHVYDDAQWHACLDVDQHDLEQGLFSIPHRWQHG